MSNNKNTDQSFLEKVAYAGNLADIYEARDLAEVVFRTMRDLMPNATVDRVASELNKEALLTEEKSLQQNISELWKDTNPLVGWLSRVRSPLEFDDRLFIRRVEQEGTMPKNTDGETVIKAVFTATKAELSGDRAKEIAQFLPGKIQQLWQSA